MLKEERTCTVDELVKNFQSGGLRENREYQRGQAWSRLQKQKFLDSIMRGYPIPMMMFVERSDVGLEGVSSTLHEIVDGLQRLHALSDYISGKYPLAALDKERRLRVPRTVQSFSKPWAGKRFDELPEDMQRNLRDSLLRVCMIRAIDHADEVRDVFIRLQGGKSLDPQQIRDSFPGPIAPFVEQLAGKIDIAPRCGLFAHIDGRGQRTEDDGRDRHIASRRTCAQLLKIFVERRGDPANVPNVSSRHLDDLYHELADFDPKSTVAMEFRQVLDDATDVLGRVNELRVHSGEKSKKVPQLEAISLVMLLQTVNGSPLLGMTPESRELLASNMVVRRRAGCPPGKGTRAATIAAYYDWWRENVAKDAVVTLDGSRAFSTKQKDEIYSRDGANCAVCSKPCRDQDAEYDHHPIPYRTGGKTEVDNGRRVHRACHSRGRPPKIIRCNIVTAPDRSASK